ncbi:MAG TPA: hypothetical protein VGE00_10640 [Gammaproteobacteria bacterium]
MNDQPPLHSSIVAMVSLAAGIAAKHPAMGLCQLQRLRDYGVPEHQIATVIEIARHIRDEAAQKLDGEFDEKAKPVQKSLPIMAAESAEGCGCSTTSSGQSCC